MVQRQNSLIRGDEQGPTRSSAIGEIHRKLNAAIPGRTETRLCVETKKALVLGYRKRGDKRSRGSPTSRRAHDEQRRRNDYASCSHAQARGRDHLGGMLLSASLYQCEDELLSGAMLPALSRNSIKVDFLVPAMEMLSHVRRSQRCYTSLKIAAGCAIRDSRCYCRRRARCAEKNLALSGFAGFRRPVFLSVL